MRVSHALAVLRVPSRTNLIIAGLLSRRGAETELRVDCLTQVNFSSFRDCTFQSTKGHAHTISSWIVAECWNRPFLRGTVIAGRLHVEYLWVASGGATTILRWLRFQRKWLSQFSR